jgi:hypothetical protein
LNKFYIKHFNDYHDIESETYKCEELGCYPAKNFDGGYNRYFGLFWKGRKPSLKKVVASMLRKVDFSENEHYFTGDDISITKADLISELKENWKLK